MTKASPLRVLHVLLSLEPGGLENGVVNYSNLLQRRGECEVHVGCIENRGAFAERLDPAIGIEALEKPPGFSVAAVRKLREMIRRLAPDVVHTHNLGTLIYAALACGRSARILHGEHAQMNADDLRCKRRMQRRVFYRFCAGVHTVSRALKDDLVAAGLGPRAKGAAVILNGVDAGRFRPAGDRDAAKTQALGREMPDARIVGVVGRFGRHKRHADLIAGFEKAAARDANLHLLVVGDHGPERERVLRAIEESPAAARIHWAGFRRDPVPCYQAMDLLVCPSENEGLSNAILEAMACGTPALATSRACGNRELIEDGVDGYLADLSTPDKIAEQLLEKAGDGAVLAEMGRAARETAKERFSLEAMADNYAGIYREIAAG